MDAQPEKKPPMADRELGAAFAAADAAAAIILRRELGEFTGKGDRDYATAADFAVENALRSQLRESTPEISFFGEEAGGDLHAERVWVLDPIDGTVNFAHDIPLCGVSLALMVGGEAQVAVIDLPFLGERFHAVRDGGSYLNGRLISVASTARLDGAIVGFGDFAFGEGAGLKLPKQLAVIAALAANVLRVRMLGSAATDLAWVAAGRQDASVTLHNNSWDMAAGVLLVREAGGGVYDFDGSSHDLASSYTVAVQPSLRSPLLSLLSHTDG